MLSAEALPGWEKLPNGLWNPQPLLLCAGAGRDRRAKESSLMGYKNYRHMPFLYSLSVSVPCLHLSWCRAGCSTNLGRSPLRGLANSLVMWRKTQFTHISLGPGELLQPS